MTEVPTARFDEESSPYFVYRARCEQVVSANTLYLEVDLGFRLQKSVYAALFGVDADSIHGVPDDSDEARRGEEQAEFVREWLMASETEYTGSDGYPITVVTLIGADEATEDYTASVFSRATMEPLNDQLRKEYPGIADL